MKKYLLIFFGLILSTTFAREKPKIILDTDFGGDADDLGALVMLHNFMDKGECDLLAVMNWSNEEFAVAGIDAVNRFYKHPDIPVGTRKNGIKHQEWTYGKAIADNFYHELNNKTAEDATTLYRKILSRSKDSSVTIVTIGPLKNIENLIRSKPDSISKLNGKELITKKVKEFVIMGGRFPKGKWEWNFDGGMPGVTKFVIRNITVPITFVGAEIGEKIKTGEILNTAYPKTPLYVGFLYFSNHAPWMKKYYNGKIINNPSYDQAAVLYAVRGGVGKFWDKIENGYCQPGNKGGNVWVESKKSNHSYLKLKMNPGKIAGLIENIMLNRFVNANNSDTR